MPIDPSKLTLELKRDYRAYLESRFFFKSPELRHQLASQLAADDRLFAGPYLELNPPFATGASVRDLAGRGVLAEDLVDLSPEALPPDRPLYRHQERAIQRIGLGRNALVATGTGSGKTEAYLLPILSHLLTERRAGALARPGIRALLLYPMNALANDQVKRLRALLGRCPEITFGRYIGETARSAKDALDVFRKVWPGEPILQNELKSREEMWASPPHILITNFAMLEYLLVRPRDASFFRPAMGERWRFLVLDEVHSYDGAKGTEIAMLLRRLKARAAIAPRGQLRCVGSSATLGGSERDRRDVVAFAGNLFGEPFGRDAKTGELDVVEAERIAPRREPDERPGSAARFYARLSHLLDGGEASAAEDIAVLLGDESAAIPRDKQARMAAALGGQPAADQRSSPGHRAAPEQAAGSPEWDWEADPGPASDRQESRPDGAAVARLLDDLLRPDRRLRALREACSRGPRALTDLAEEVFQDDPADSPGRLAGLLALVSLATHASAGPGAMPLITARYHFFVRALEGGFLCLGDHDGQGPKLHLERRKTCASCEGLGVFEIGACRRCGEEVLVGAFLRDGGITRFASEDPTQDTLEEGSRIRRAFLSLRRWAAAPVNEDEADEGEPAARARGAGAQRPRVGQPGPAGSEEAGTRDDADFDLPLMRLCRRCGALESVDRALPCGCPEAAALVVNLLPSRGRELKLCPSCGSRSLQRDLLQTLYTGTDEPVAEIATTVFQALNEGFVRQGEPKRKLLAFSDSRQDAAYFAPYLESLYRRSLRSHVILEAVERAHGPVPVVDLAERLVGILGDRGWLGRDATPGELETEAWSWILAELMHSAKDRRGLEALGLVDFRLRRSSDVVPPPPLLRPPWSLCAAEAWSLVQVLVDSLRDAYAVRLTGGVRPDADVFAPARAGRSVVLQRGPMDRRSVAWVPQRASGTNARLDFLRRVVARRSIPASDEQIKSFLRELFTQYMTSPRGPFLATYLQQQTEASLGSVLFALEPRGWEIVPAALLALYRCSRCGSISADSISGVCPTFRCDGTLEPIADKAGAASHVRDRYRRLREVWMTAREHTAQLDALSAAEVQSRFGEGDIDVLSCSTTFELGVDLGELDTILMRNVPPTPANYAQRAGRAGRRLGAAAVVVTYAQRRSHDLAFFRAPLRMISGRVRPPSFRLDNARIVRRHVFATALGSFFLEDPDAFGKGEIASLLERSVPGQDGVERLLRFLAGRPAELGRALVQIVPEDLVEALGVRSWAWADELLDGPRVSLRSVQAEFEADCARYREAEQLASKDGHHKQAAMFKHLRNTVERRQLLSVLANRGLFPKYGFPVDVISLAIDPEAARAVQDCGEAVALDLTRDLALAIAEYAPGAEVVAAGHVWRSAGLKVIPDRRLEEISYLDCDCGAFATLRPGEQLAGCAVCGAVAGPRLRRYVRPEFGFVTSAERPKRTSTRRPERQYASRVAFERYVADAPAQLVERWPGIRVGTPLLGRLVTVNRGRGRGFRLCQSCGYAELLDTSSGTKPAGSHQRLRGGTCRDQVTWGVDLGHDFITDVLELRLDQHRLPWPQHWASVGFAILEGVPQALGIRREDLNAIWRRGADGDGCVFLYDAVPGGAGHVARIHEHLSVVLAEALRRVSACSCEESTSCYECLRSFANQRIHGQLERGVARQLLEEALGSGAKRGRRQPKRDRDYAKEVLELIADQALREIVRKLVGRGAAVPEVGYELLDESGRVLMELEVAWPHVRVGVRARRDAGGGADGDGAACAAACAAGAPPPDGWTLLDAGAVAQVEEQLARALVA